MTISAERVRVQGPKFGKGGNSHIRSVTEGIGCSVIGWNEEIYYYKGLTKCEKKALG